MINRFLIIVFSLILTACSGYRDDKPATYDELLDSIRVAIDRDDTQYLENLYDTTPEWLSESPDFFRETLKALGKTQYQIDLTDCYPFIADGKVIYLPNTKFIRVIGSDGPRGEMGTATYTFTAIASTNNGVAELYDLNKDRLNAYSTESNFEYELVVLSEKKDILMGNLKNKQSESFGSSWNGSDFISYSMSDFATFLGSRCGFPVINRTDIEGDYDFQIEFGNLEDPSAVRIDLWQVGLDLLLVEKTTKYKSNQRVDPTR